MLPALRVEHDVRVLAVGAPHEQVEPWLHTVAPPAGAAAGLRDWRQFLVHRRPRRADELVRCLQPALRGELRRFDPDVVHVFSNLLAPVHRVLDGRPTVLSGLDAAHRNVAARAARARGPRRLALRAEARRVTRYIANEYPAYDEVVMVTPQDAAAVAELAGEIRVSSIPNGVDAARFGAGTPAAPVPGRLVLHGAMSYAPNVDAALFAAHEVLPRVRSEAADAELVLVGRSPSAEVRALAGLPGVTVTGEVDDVAPWLQSAAVYLCPMRSGTGIKNKLLEAMAAAAPCVATPLALQGIEAEPGRDVLVGAGADELASHVLALLEDPERAGVLGGRARRCVVDHHSWEAAARAYSELYARVAAPG
jgi:polysaccharide biosynthesis protein PslH